MPKERILVVENEPRILDIAERILTKADFEMGAAGSGEEALGIMGEQKYDLLLTDIKMPGMSGMELLRRFHIKWNLLELLC